jgi:hypothetical protein
MPTENAYRPCLGCGYCCTVATCAFGAERFGPHGGPCPALTYRDGRYWCGVILEADEVQRPHYERVLHIGAGCCSSLNSYRRKLACKSTHPGDWVRELHRREGDALRRDVQDILTGFDTPRSTEPER